MRRIFITFSAIIALLVATTSANAAESEPTPGRVSALEGTLRLRDPVTRMRNRLTLNSFLRSGDELTTPTGSFAEIELEGGSFVRMAGGTAIAIDLFEASYQVVLLHGSITATRGSLAPPLSVAALAGRVALDSNSAVRIDLDRHDMLVEVRATEGRVDYVTGLKTDRLGAGQKLTHRPGSTERSTWDGSHDALDRWVNDRSRWIAQRRPPARLSNARNVGLYDLHDHGRWVVVGGRWGWRPDVAVSWRPYQHGKWSWADSQGWIWVSDASWGYVTHHYGRWVHDVYIGWVWIPGDVWGPAWVAWATAGPYIGWAPLGPDGYAVAFRGSPGTYDADCWLLASAAYFFFGGGCYSDCNDVIVTVNQTTLAGYDPTPVETPSSDLAPPESTDSGSEANNGGSALVASMNSIPSPAMQRARRALTKAKLRPERRSNGPRFARGHRRGGFKGEAHGRRSSFDDPARSRAAARRSSTPARHRPVTTRPAPSSFPTGHERSAARPRRPVVQYPATVDQPAPAASIPSRPSRPSTPAPVVSIPSRPSRRSAPTRSYVPSSSSSSSRSYQRRSSSAPSRSYSPPSRSRSSSPSRPSPRYSAPSSSSSSSNNSKKSSAKKSSSSSKPAPKRSSSRSSKRSPKPRR